MSLDFADNYADLGETPFKKNCVSFKGFQKPSYVIVFLFSVFRVCAIIREFSDNDSNGKENIT